MWQKHSRLSTSYFMALDSSHTLGQFCRMVFLQFSHLGGCTTQQYADSFNWLPVKRQRLGNMCKNVKKERKQGGKSKNKSQPRGNLDPKWPQPHVVSRFFGKTLPNLPKIKRFGTCFFN